MFKCLIWSLNIFLKVSPCQKLKKTSEELVLTSLDQDWSKDWSRLEKTSLKWSSPVFECSGIFIDQLVSVLPKKPDWTRLSNTTCMLLLQKLLHGHYHIPTKWKTHLQAHTLHCLYLVWQGGRAFLDHRDAAIACSQNDYPFHHFLLLRMKMV